MQSARMAAPLRRCWGPRSGCVVGLVGPEGEEVVVLEEGVEAAEAEAEEDAGGEGAAAFAGDEDVGAGGAFGVDEGAVLFDDELAAERDHEEDAEPAAEEGEGEDARWTSRSKPRKMSAGRVKMTPEAMDWPAFPVVWTMLFSRMLAAAEGSEDGDGEDGDGDGGGDGEAGAEAYVDGDGSEEDAEDGAEDEGADGELGAGLGGGDEGFEGGLGGC